MQLSKMVDFGKSPLEGLCVTPAGSSLQGLIGIENEDLHGSPSVAFH
jgi:hypothetical protein